MSLSNWFDEEAQRRISAAVAAAESRSEGQIVPVVVERSDDFREARYRAGLLGALGLTSIVLLLHDRLPPLHLQQLSLLQALGWSAGWLLCAWAPLRRILVGRQRRDEVSRGRALRAFHEHGLQHTSKGTGVLIFASLFERSVVILGDRGIDAQMGEQGWRAAVDALVGAIRAGRPAEGFVEAITRCGDVLATHFPRSGEPVLNSLPDHIRLDDPDGRS